MHRYLIVEVEDRSLTLFDLARRADHRPREVSLRFRDHVVRLPPFRALSTTRIVAASAMRWSVDPRSGGPRLYSPHVSMCGEGGRDESSGGDITARVAVLRLGG
jgi:hypothetical protein